MPPALKLAPDGPRSRRSGRISASSAKPNVTSGARLTSASSSASRRPQTSPTLTAAGGAAAPDEQLPLRREVVLHRLVEVEVILAQIGEDERIKADAVEPVQHRRMRGRLERDAAIAGVEHLTEGALEIDGLGCRAYDRAHSAADPALDGAEQAGTPPRGLEHRVEEECGCRLPARAGDAGDLELARRLAEEDVGRGRHRRPRGRDNELGYLRLDGPLDDEDDGAVLDRLYGEVVAVCALAGNGEEGGARRDGTCLVGKVPHLDGVGAAENRLRCERGNEALELHGGERYRVARLEAGAKRPFRGLRARNPLCGVRACDG